MSTIRISKNKNNPYLIMNKTCLNDNCLSWKAKGLLCYLLSLPDDWQIYENELINHAKDGRDSTKTAIKELINNGYIERERKRDKKGHLRGYDYTVYEIPYNGKPNVGKPNVGKPVTTNIINKPSNNELSNKYLIGNESSITFDVFINSKGNLSSIENIESIKEIVSYYVNKYKNIYNKEIKYNESTWIKICEGILENDTEIDLSYKDNYVHLMKEAIDKHFDTFYKHKEMYLLHNFKGKCKDNRLFEAGIL